LVFLMGIRMGSNQEIINNLGAIGLQSLLFTVVVMAGSVFAVIVTRTILGIDKYGRLKARTQRKSERSFATETAGRTADGVAVDSVATGGSAVDGIAAGGTADGRNMVSQTELELRGEAESEEASEREGTSVALMTWLIITFVILGLLFGYFYIRTHLSDVDGFNDKAGNVMTLGLCILMASIGFDMGLAGTVAGQIKQIGLRVLVFPFAIILGTALSSVLISFFLPLSMRECLAVGFGFGWYTFAPVSIAGAGHVMASAVSFMHNVFRETFGIVLIPVLAKKIGYIEVCSLPGVAAADIGLTLVEKAARPDIIVYSFAIGIVESLLIPLLVTLAIGA